MSNKMHLIILFVSWRGCSFDGILLFAFVSSCERNVPWKHESWRKGRGGGNTLTRFGIAASASRGALWLVQVTWTVTSGRQLRPIKSTYILPEKESAKACLRWKQWEKKSGNVERVVGVFLETRGNKMTEARRGFVI